MYLNDDRRVYAVADGLGGLPKGSLASTMAIEILEECISDPGFNGTADYGRIFNHINKRVFEEGRRVSSDIGIGTTLTVARLNEDGIVEIGHVGDCSCFLVRDGEINSLTTDHTMEEEIRSRLKPGEDAYIPEYFAHTLTRCIGQQGLVETDTIKESLVSGDRIIICSDGITKVLDDAEVLDLALSADDPEDLTRKLIDEANARGGPDNATVVTVWIDNKA